MHDVAAMARGRRDDVPAAALDDAILVEAARRQVSYRDC